MKPQRVIGIFLLLWAYGMNVHAVIGAWRESSPQPTVHSPQEPAQHSEHTANGPEHSGHQPDLSAVSEKKTPKWRIVLTAALLVAGAALALGPIALGKPWGVRATWLVLIGIAGPRIVTDPRCWVAYDPTKHGCHTFLISLVIAATGLALCWVSMRGPKS